MTRSSKADMHILTLHCTALLCWLHAPRCQTVCGRLGQRPLLPVARYHVLTGGSWIARSLPVIRSRVLCSWMVRRRSLCQPSFLVALWAALYVVKASATTRRNLNRVVGGVGSCPVEAQHLQLTSTVHGARSFHVVYTHLLVPSAC